MPDSPTPPDTPGDAPGHAHDDAPGDAASGAPAPGRFQVLDLSSSDGRGSTEPASWKRKRKQASPVLTKIVDLSAPASPKADPAPPENQPARAKRAKGAAKGTSSGRSERSPRGGGSTLADLLDPETLARLRGED